MVHYIYRKYIRRSLKELNLLIKLHIYSPTQITNLGPFWTYSCCPLLIGTKTRVFRTLSLSLDISNSSSTTCIYILKFYLTFSSSLYLENYILEMFLNNTNPHSSHVYVTLHQVRPSPTPIIYTLALRAWVVVINARIREICPSRLRNPSLYRTVMYLHRLQFQSPNSFSLRFDQIDWFAIWFTISAILVSFSFFQLLFLFI